MNNLKSLLNRDEATVPIDNALKERLRSQFAPARRQFIWPLLFPVVGIATFALIITTSPLSFSPETSFLQRAQAAYEEIAERAETEGLIHHTVMEILQQPGSISEQWSSVSGDFSLFVDQENGRKFMTVGKNAYVLPSENAQARAGQAAGDRLGATDGPRYVLRTPDNVSSTRIETDPEDPTVTCYSFEYQTEEQQAESALVKKISTWQESDGSIESMRDLLDTLHDPRFEDIGKLTLETGESVHGYRLNTTSGIDPEHIMRMTFEFFLDPSTYLLVTSRLIVDDGFSALDTTDFHYVENEFVSIDTFDATFFVPETYGLEPMDTSDHPENMPSYDLREGCIRQNIDAPEYLSDEEATAVRARIKTADNR
jgi:hypothetical protein